MDNQIFTINAFDKDGNLLGSERDRGGGAVHVYKNILLQEFPLAAKITVSSGDELLKWYDCAPLTQEEIHLEAAKAFAEEEAFYRGNIEITVNAARKRFYYLHADGYRFNLAKAQGRFITLCHITPGDYANCIESDYLRARYNDILKAVGSSTRLLVNGGTWVIITDADREQRIFDYKGLEISLRHIS